MRIQKEPSQFDRYVARFPPQVRTILRKIRRTIKAAAPEAEELFSYRMPAFRQQRILAYFAAFKNHVGLYPPVRGDAKLLRDVSPYAGPKGNLRFPLGAPIPYDLVRRIVKSRLAALKVKRAPTGRIP